VAPEKSVVGSQTPLVQIALARGVFRFGCSCVKKSRTKAAKHSESQGLKMDTFCDMEGDTLVLNILGTPNASKDAIGKPLGAQLRVSVTAVPVAGRATDHMMRFLAAKFGVCVHDITVVFGRFSIHKQMRIRAPKRLPAVVAKALVRANPTTS